MPFIACCSFCQHRTSPIESLNPYPPGWRNIGIVLDMNTRHGMIMCPMCATRLQMPPSTPYTQLAVDRFIEVLRDMVREEVEDASPQR